MLRLFFILTLLLMLGQNVTILLLYRKRTFRRSDEDIFDDVVGME